jgi:hypothetical protein
MRIYQGGKDPVAPVTVTAKVFDRNATTIGEGTDVLAPDHQLAPLEQVAKLALAVVQ